MNIRIEYMYRDAANYKRYAEAVLGNPSNYPLEEIRQMLVDATQPWQLFGDVLHFRPELVGLATCYFSDAGYEPNDDDIDLHEVHSISQTDDSPTECRDIDALIEELRDCGPRGFEPLGAALLKVPC